ncbi:hypothetical protein E8E13_003764 [Curvularia kusanoi]|uniref:Uncharacterized protein n=1 Tax=Curvularia kusanoi TaxID=90978 RepID=A0A9P4T9L3_CURKU|nr:hypothetical protein E8E13_003764 [Curvularia kusanoi]
MACRDMVDSDALEEQLDLEYKMTNLAGAWVDFCEAWGTQLFEEYAQERHSREVLARYSSLQDAINANSTFPEMLKWWKNKIMMLENALLAMMEEYYNGNNNITVRHWNAFSRGHEKALIVILQSRFPVWSWPREVPYPNLIALDIYQKEEAELKELYRGRYAAAVESIADLGVENRAMKQLAGDTSDGMFWHIPIVPEQMHAWRATIYKEKQNRFTNIKLMLKGQPVLKPGWDLAGFVDVVMEQLGIETNREVRVDISAMVEALIEQWYDDTDHNAGPDDKFEMDYNYPLQDANIYTYFDSVDDSAAPCAAEYDTEQYMEERRMDLD